MAFPVYVASGTKTANIGANTPAAPASIAAGDILLMCVESNGEAISLTTAQGFVEVTNSPQSPGAATTRLAVYWKRAVGADTMPTVADVGDHTGIVVHQFSGCVGIGNPWDATNGGTELTSDTSWATNGVTTTRAECLICEIVAGGFDTATAQSSGEANASLANLTERNDSWMSTGDGGGMVLVTGEKATAGATGSTTGTLANASAKAFMTIALMPPKAPPFGHPLAHRTLIRL